jgi:hypothetical protein
MKKLIFMMSCIAMFAAACTSDKKDTSADSAKIDTNIATAPDTAAMNKAWASYMTPGAPHQMLAKADGKWDAEISFYYNPDSPSVNKVSCENKMILGGRYQQSTYKGNLDGMPFEGIGTVAYDNSRKIFVSSWVDNMGTGLMYLEGTYDEGAKIMTLKGKGVDVTTGKDISIRETFQFVDDNHQQMEMYEMKDDKETKTMSIKLTRTK